MFARELWTVNQPQFYADNTKYYANHLKITPKKKNNICTLTNSIHDARIELILCAAGTSCMCVYNIRYIYTACSLAGWFVFIVRAAVYFYSLLLSSVFSFSYICMSAFLIGFATVNHIDITGMSCRDWNRKIANQQCEMARDAPAHFHIGPILAKSISKVLRIFILPFHSCDNQINANQCKSSYITIAKYWTAIEWSVEYFLRVLFHVHCTWMLLFSHC